MSTETNETGQARLFDALLRERAALGGESMIVRLAASFVIATWLVLGSPIIVSSTATSAPMSLHLFTSEPAAQKHCPKDEVVWLNTSSGIYHEKGMRWYGNTRHGAYVCRKEADAAGDRDTRNGQ